MFRKIGKLKMASSKFCLKWNDFQNNLIESFKELRDDTALCDVTLVSMDGHQVKAHRIILTASSPIFMNIFKNNTRSNPMIYMRGINTRDLDSIVDFMYYGEANIDQDNVEAFLALADELQLQGLSGTEQNEKMHKNELSSNSITPTTNKVEVSTNELSEDLLDPFHEFPLNTIPETEHSQIPIEPSLEPIESNISSNVDQNLTLKVRKDDTKPTMSKVVSKKKHNKPIKDKLLKNKVDKSDANSVSQTLPTDLSKEQEKVTLKQKLESMIEKVDSTWSKPGYTGWRCKSCGKVNNNKMAMKSHAETHIDGISLPCNICGKVFR